MARIDTDPVTFFFEHGGFSFDPRVETELEGHMRCARDLTAAEEWARREGVIFVWENDPDDSGDGDETPKVREACFAYDDGEVAASLSGIGDATDEYRRVVEAELAAEVMADVESGRNVEPSEEPDMRAHRLAGAIVAAMIANPAKSVYNVARDVLIEEFTQ